MTFHCTVLLICSAILLGIHINRAINWPPSKKERQKIKERKQASKDRLKI